MDRVRLEKKWRLWLEEDWYGEVVRFRLFGLTNKEKESHQLANRIRKKAASFRLTERGDESVPSLVFVERNGSQLWCVRPLQVQSVLSHYHDNHGHFSTETTQRRLIGAYYWPSRMRDTAEFCRSCIDCQFFGPRKPSQTVLPILHLQPMDMMGMDYLGPISPKPQSGNRYVYVMVDYFSRHC